MVVNCFQNSVSLIFWTTLMNTIIHEIVLWIAFKILYLWYSEQLRFPRISATSGCELLSKFCIFDILNNLHSGHTQQGEVVNCFQNSVSLIFWTTSFRELKSTRELWIAFKILYLWYSEQLPATTRLLRTGCELLSKFCIFDILNNLWPGIYAAFLVVNCFQNSVSLIFWTTGC